MNETSKTSKTSNPQRTRKVRAKAIEARAIEQRVEIAGRTGLTGRTGSSPLGLILARFDLAKRPVGPAIVDAEATPEQAASHVDVGMDLHTPPAEPWIEGAEVQCDPALVAAKNERFCSVSVERPDGRGWHDSDATPPSENLATVVVTPRAGRDGRPHAADSLSLAERVELGYVNRGWTPQAWADRLRQLADRCEAVHPALAAQHRRWAANMRGNEKNRHSAR